MGKRVYSRNYQKIKGGFILTYGRYLYGEILLREELLRKNKIYHDVELEYYKIKNGNDRKNENFKYGIEVVKKEYMDNEIKQENSVVEMLTSSEEKVEKILEKLKNNAVTPITLEYVIADMFA